MVQKIQSFKSSVRQTNMVGIVIRAPLIPQRESKKTGVKFSIDKQLT